MAPKRKKNFQGKNTRKKAHQEISLLNYLASLDPIHISDEIVSALSNSDGEIMTQSLKDFRAFFEGSYLVGVEADGNCLFDCLIRAICGPLKFKPQALRNYVCNCIFSEDEEVYRKIVLDDERLTDIWENEELTQDNKLKTIKSLFKDKTTVYPGEAILQWLGNKLRLCILILTQGPEVEDDASNCKKNYITLVNGSEILMISKSTVEETGTRLAKPAYQHGIFLLQSASNFLYTDYYQLHFDLAIFGFDHNNRSSLIDFASPASAHIRTLCCMDKYAGDTIVPVYDQHPMQVISTQHIMYYDEWISSIQIVMLITSINIMMYSIVFINQVLFTKFKENNEDAKQMTVQQSVIGSFLQVKDNKESAARRQSDTEYPSNEQVIT
jgi:hypothetical protein